MDRKFKLGDIVKLRFEPYCEMSIHSLLGTAFGGTKNNPLYNCKYYDSKTNSFKVERFLESDLDFIQKE